MKKLYEKNEVLFAVLWIAVYVAGSGFGDSLAETKAVTLGFQLVLAAALTLFILRNRLGERYGLADAGISGGRGLRLLPLAVIATVNIWFGVELELSAGAAVLYVLSMLAAGYLEELIFRGLLFRAMEKDGLKSALIVSSLTFGIGHLVNLLNGAEPISTLCQLVYAAALGFLFCVIFYRGGSLWPCILTHGVLNALSAFSHHRIEAFLIPVSAALTLLSLGYALSLWKTLPRKAGK